jgi:hypothetical protein
MTRRALHISPYDPVRVLQQAAANRGMIVGLQARLAELGAQHLPLVGPEILECLATISHTFHANRIITLACCSLLFRFRYQSSIKHNVVTRLM